MRTTHRRLRQLIHEELRAASSGPLSENLYDFFTDANDISWSRVKPRQVRSRIAKALDLSQDVQAAVGTAGQRGVQANNALERALEAYVEGDGDLEALVARAEAGDAEEEEEAEGTEESETPAIVYQENPDSSTVDFQNTPGSNASGHANDVENSIYVDVPWEGEDVDATYSTSDLDWDGVEKATIETIRDEELPTLLRLTVWLKESATWIIEEDEWGVTVDDDTVSIHIEHGGKLEEPAQPVFLWLEMSVVNGTERAGKRMVKKFNDIGGPQLAQSVKRLMTPQASAVGASVEDVKISLVEEEHGEAANPHLHVSVQIKVTPEDQSSFEDDDLDTIEDLFLRVLRRELPLVTIPPTSDAKKYIPKQGDSFKNAWQHVGHYHLFAADHPPELSHS